MARLAWRMGQAKIGAWIFVLAARPARHRLACSRRAACGESGARRPNASPPAPRAWCRERARARAGAATARRVRRDRDRCRRRSASSSTGGGRRSPTANFLAYVDQHRFDGTFFYRAARHPRRRTRGFIQGGIRRNYRRMLPPIAHEPTSRTGLRHVDGTISMARAEPGRDGRFLHHRRRDAVDGRGTGGDRRASPPSAGWSRAWTWSAASSPRRPSPMPARGAMRGQMIERAGADRLGETGGVGSGRGRSRS